MFELGVKAKASVSSSRQGSLLERSGDSFPVWDSSIHDFGGDHRKQNFRLGGLGGGIFCDRRRHCVAGWSRGKIHSCWNLIGQCPSRGDYLSLRVSCFVGNKPLHVPQIGGVRTLAADHRFPAKIQRGPTWPGRFFVIGTVSEWMRWDYAVRRGKRFQTSAWAPVRPPALGPSVWAIVIPRGPGRFCRR